MHRASKETISATRSFSAIQDRQLVLNAQKDPPSFEALYHKYQKPIFRYFWYRLNDDRSLAEDFTQEVFLRAFYHLDHYDYLCYSYLSFLHTIAHNLLIDYFRTKKPLSLESLTELPDPSIDLSRRAELKLLWDRVKHLSPLEQRVLAMKYHQDLPVRTIAQQLKKSENAIKLTLSHARKKLRKEALCITCSN